MSDPATLLLPPEFHTSYSAGRFHDAFASIAGAFTSLAKTADLPAVLQLHELCLKLGFETRRRWLARQIWGRWPDRLPARSNQVRERLRRGRLLSAWELTRGLLPTADDAVAAMDWELSVARVHSQLRDFPSAMAGLERAEAVLPGHPDILRERIWTQLDQDDVQGAIERLASAMANAPTDLDLQLQNCWLHHNCNHPATSEILATVRQRCQSPVLDTIHANHCLELGAAAAARDILRELLRQPHHEPRMRRGWRFLLIRACRDLGDDAAALAAAEENGRHSSEEANRLREHLQAPQPATRVVLPVPYVRQDHMTCSPATMASLLQFFCVDVEQREIARQITVDGTSSHDELQWAEQRGLVMRWFTFDPAVARDLLRRGLPFAFTTRFESSSHRQALVGFDSVLDTFVLRDPASNCRRELPTKWLTTIAQRGGECALLLPREIAATHELPPLPAESAALAWLRARLDWREHRPKDAEARLKALGELPAGPLRFDIELRLATEHADRRRQLQLWRERWQAAPEDPFFRAHYAAELLDQNRWRDASELLAEWAPGSRSPLLLQMLAEQWRVDARRRADAEWLLRRSLAINPGDGRCWHRLARVVAADPQRRELATELTRLAACLQPFDEWLAAEHYRQLCNCGQAAAGLAFLANRRTVRGDRSATMAITYAKALEEQQDPDAAVAVLQQHFDHDDDAAAVRLHAIGLLCRLRRFDDAAALLSNSALRPIDSAWARHELATTRGDHDAARMALQAVLAIDPWHDGAQALRLEGLLENEGLTAALDAARRLAVQPAATPALLVRIATFQERCNQPTAAEELLRRLVAEHPQEFWLQGRLARHLLHRGRYDEARPWLLALRETTPESSAVWFDLGLLHHHDGDLDAARTAMRRCFDIDAANIGAIRYLVDWAADEQNAVTELRFALRTIAERPQPPDFGMLVGLQDLLPALPTAEVEDFFAALAAAHPREIDHRMARIDYVGRNDPAAAAELAAQLAAERPWEPGHTLRHARWLRELGRNEAEREALHALLARDPGCAQAYADLAESLHIDGHPQQAMAALERGLLHAPGHATLHGMLANMAWAQGARDRALAAITRATELDTSYRWAWLTRVEWLVALDQRDEALQIAERFASAQPRDELAHEVHANALAALGRHDERLQALRRALQLGPRLGANRLRLVDALIELKRFDEARDVLATGAQLQGEQPEFALRLAEMERTEGRHALAREQLRAALTRHPDFRGGWVRWMSWCEEENREADILALASSPPPALASDPVLYGYSGGARRKLGDPVGAAKDLRRALELAPGYGWARLQLCELALERGAPEEVLELLGDHQDLDAQPFDHAALIAQAAARRRDPNLAGQAFARLLRQPDAAATTLGTVDAICCERIRTAHLELLQRLSEDAGNDVVQLRNLALVHAQRRDHPAFWRCIQRIEDASPAEAALATVVEILAASSEQLQERHIARWAERHVRTPIADPLTTGRLMCLLSNKAGHRLNVRLFGSCWRRTDLQGYMLANLGDSLRRCGHWQRSAEVADFALRELPHDHSIWWHRRNRAEQALRNGDLTAVRQLCGDSSPSYPLVALALHQLDLLAELRSLPRWRRPRALRRRLREMFRRFQAAMAAFPHYPKGPSEELRRGQLLLACPSLTTLLLQSTTCRQFLGWLYR